MHLFWFSFLCKWGKINKFIASTVSDPKGLERSELDGRESDFIQLHILPADLALTQNSTKCSRKEVVNRKRSRGWLVYPYLREFLWTSEIKRKHNLKPKAIDWFTHIYKNSYGLNLPMTSLIKWKNQTTNLKKLHTLCSHFFHKLTVIHIPYPPPHQTL